MAALVVTTAAVVVVGVGLVVLVTSTSSTALLDLEVGDCFGLPSMDDAAADSSDERVDVIETVDVIDCDDQHDAEVVGVGLLNPEGDLDYPSDEELFAVVDARCASVDAVPTDRFGVVPIAPTERSWASFDGRYLCIAVPFGGDLVSGSLADR